LKYLSFFKKISNRKFHFMANSTLYGFWV